MGLDKALVERSIVARLPMCSLDELRVIERVLVGIEKGRTQYGPLDVSRDPRRWLREGRAELRDWLFYFAAHEVAEDVRDEARDREESSRNTGALVEWRRAYDESRELCVCGHAREYHAKARYGCICICDCLLFRKAG